MEWLWDALVDSALLIPTLFLAYVLIEVIETATSKKMNNHNFLRGKTAPLLGASFGMIPQCGFSVVATDLYSRQKISVGTLIAIFVATSDEALPILLGNLTSLRILYLLLGLIAVKFVVGVLSGYLVDFINNKFISVKPIGPQNITTLQLAGMEEPEQNTQQPHDHHEKENDCHEEALSGTLQQSTIHKGCCGHEIEEDHIHPAKQYVLHPLIHTLKVFAYILIVNVILGACIHYIGEDKIAKFLLTNRYYAPLLAALVGLIPNCASSVILTNLCISGALTFSACITGLIINAGIAYLVLFRQNKNRKANFAIVGTMCLVGLITGYLLLLFGI